MRKTGQTTKLSDKTKGLISGRSFVRFLWCLALIAGVFSFTNTHPIRPNDFWWHLALGRVIYTTGRIPAVDTYSYTMAGQPYLGYQMFWLADTGLYLLYQFGGPALILLANSLVITLAYLLILVLCRRVSQGWGAPALALFFAIALGIHNWNVRPQSLSYLLGAFFLSSIYALRQKSRVISLPRRLALLAVFPAGMLLWVNIHGSFVIGFFLLLIWLADEVRAWLVERRWSEPDRSTQVFIIPAAALILTALASLVNPRGFEVFAYVIDLSTAPVIQNQVPEWSPPVFGAQIGTVFFLGLLFNAAILALSPRRPSFFEMISFLGFALLSLKTTRGIVWFGLVMAPVLSGHLTALADRRKAEANNGSETRRSPLINIAFLLLLTGMAVLSLPWLKNLLPLPTLKSGLISEETPVEATEFLLQERPPENLFHEMGFGSYLIWAAQPQYRVFADPRIELYPREIWIDYLWISNAIPGWEERLEKYGIRTLLLSPREQPELIAAADSSAHWKRIYKDDAAVIFTRND